jgi:hypothetical protein
MIQKEFFSTRGDGVRLYRTYSDDGLVIRQIETGELYDEAVDVENAEFTYEETQELINNNIEDYGEGN